MEENGVMGIVKEEADAPGDQTKAAKARNLIVQGLDDSILESVMGKKTAHEMWTTLTATYEQKGLQGQLTYRRKLHSMKMDKNVDMTSHLHKIEETIRLLKEAGGKIEDDEIICVVLNSLPENYQTIVTVIENATPALTLEQVKNKLRAEFEKLKGQNVDSSTTHSNAFACWTCNGSDHYSRDCPKNKNTSNQSFRGGNSSRSFRGGRGRSNFRNRGRGNRGGHFSNAKSAMSENEISFVALSEGMSAKEDSSDDVVFLLDSGATDHLVSAKLERFMTDIEQLPKPVEIIIANGQKLCAKKKGRLRLSYEGREINLQAIIVKDLSHNLLSVNQLTRKGIKVIFCKDYAELSSNSVNFQFSKCGKVYRIQFQLRNETAAYSTKQDVPVGVINKKDAKLWHRRMGHLNRRSMRMMGLPVEEEVCETCVKGKMTRLPFVSCKKPRSSRIGEVLHTDLCGPISPSTRGNQRYFQVIVDDYSHFTVVYLLQNKNEAASNVIDFVNKLEAKHNTRVHCIRCDNGGEFINRQLLNFAKEKGIQVKQTIAYTSQQNGVSERFNRLLLDVSRTMMCETDLSKEFWGDAVLSAAYVLNRRPSRAIEGRTPASIWFGTTDLKKVRVFGCKCYYSPLPRQSKLDERGKEARLLGYVDNGWRLWDIEDQKVIVARDVKFIEKEEKKTVPRVVTVHGCDEGGEERVQSEEEEEESEDEEPTRYEKDEDYIQTSSEDSTKSTPERNRKKKKKKNARKVSSLKSNSSRSPKETTEDEPEEEIDGETVSERPRRAVNNPKKYDDYELYMACNAYIDEVPNCPEDLQYCNEKVDWEKAMQREMTSIEDNGTWEVVEKPRNANVIDTRWIFSYKENEKGENRFKARLVARGFAQEDYFDYTDIQWWRNT